MSQKFLITLTVISLSFTAFLGGYLISQKDFHKNTGSISGNILDKFSDTDPISNPRIESSRTLRLLSPRNVISPAVSKEKNSVIYYEKSTGKVFEVTLNDLKEKSVSDIPLANLIKTIWAPSKKEVISAFYHPNGSRYKYFNYKTKASVDLGINIESLVFSPNGSQIAYFGKNRETRGVFISQPDGSILKNILPSRLEDMEIYWPSEDLLFFKTTTANGSELYSLSKTGEVKKILDLKNNLDVKWSKDGSQILFSQNLGSGISLFYKDLPSGSKVPLGVSTSASKCDWGIAGETIVCGVPKSSASGDEIYEIGLDGTRKLISSPTTKVITTELFLAGIDDYVVILNSLDNKLYVLKK